MSQLLNDLKTYARLPFGLGPLLSERITLEDARRIVETRMKHRADNFLHTAVQKIYANPRSPYLPLLKMARCEPGDLSACVERNGLDATLKQLRAEGVYITFEEYKGRTPVVRNGCTFLVSPTDFDNPNLKSILSLESGGTTGAPTPTPVDMSHLRAGTPLQWVRAEAYDLLDAPQVIWHGILPASTLVTFIQRARMNRMPERWFSHTMLRESKYWFKYGLATYYTVLWMRLFGVRMPLPEYVPIARADVIAQEIAEQLKRHGRCSANMNVSRALRVSLVAQERGWDFSGVVFIGGGEPCTPAKVKAIEKCGARFYPGYNLMEVGVLASGCVNPAAPDDVHLVEDSFALITHPHSVEGFSITVDALNLTTLLPSAHKVLLNFQMDDYAIVEQRACGCPFEKLGFTTHLSEIRSYRKLTGEGVTLVGQDMLNILELVLPARYGGSPLDYQLMEQEDTEGFTRLYLIIHPRVEITDEQEVLDLVLKQLRETSSMADVAGSGWRQADSLKIKRMEPRLTARGKLYPLHLERTVQKSHIP